MDRETKEISYQKIYQKLKEMFGSSALSYPEDRKNYEFTCKIGNISVEYILFADKDLLKIKAGMKFPGYSDDQLFNLGDSLKRKADNLYFTYYDEQLFLQRAYTFVGISDKDAADQVYQIAVKFFDFLKENSDILHEAQGISEKKVYSEQKESGEDFVPNKDWLVTKPNLDFSQDVEESEDADVSQESLPQEEPFQETPQMKSSFSQQPPQEEPARNQQPPVISESESGHDTVIRGTVIAETLVADKVVFTHAAEDSVQEKKQEDSPEYKREDEREEKRMEKNTEANTEEILDETPGESSDENPGENWDEKQDEVKEVPEMSLEDLFSGGNIPVGSSEGRKKRKKMKPSKTSKPTEGSSDLSVPNTLIPDSIQKMYDEMDQAFESRKQQLDYRSATLDARATKLDEQESAIEIKERELQKAMDEKYLDREIQVREREEAVDAKEKELFNFEQELKSSEKDLESLKVNYQNAMISLESERRSYGLKWKQLDMEKETLQARERDLNERAALIGKIGTSSKDLHLLQQENESLKKQIDMLKNRMEQRNSDEVSRLKKELAKNADMMDEMMNAINEYQDKIENLEKGMSDAASPILSLEELAYRSIEELKEVQVNVELISSESDCILAGEKENYKVVVNLTAGMLYIEKDLKRSFKYQKLLDDWNQEDICKAYILSLDKVICKCSFKQNLSENVLAIINRLDSLK